MCIVCVEFQQRRLTFREARNALREMRDTLPADHVEALEEELRWAILDADGRRIASVPAPADPQDAAAP